MGLSPKLSRRVEQPAIDAAKPKQVRANRQIWLKGRPDSWKVRSEGRTIYATLPYPLSGNECMRYAVVKGRVASFQSKDLIAYKKLVAELFDAGMVGPTAEPVVFTATLYRPQRSGDIDNRMKALWDALNGNAWQDDNQVVAMHVTRAEDPASPRVEVTITPHAGMANEVLDL